MKRFALIIACFTFSFTAQAADKKIERLFGSKCGSCHGKDGKAQTEKGKKMQMRDLASEEFQKTSDEDMTKAINDGLKKDKGGVKQEMEGFKDDIKAPEVEALVKYMREFKK
jgi:mono/diheme cytochrome c family protein